MLIKVKNRKNILNIFLCLFALLFLFVSIQNNDAIEINEEINMHINENSNSSYILNSNFLYSGNYKITIKYASNSDNNHFELINMDDMSVINTDNYNIENDKCIFNIESNKTIKNLQLKSYAEDGVLEIKYIKCFSNNLVYSDRYWTIAFICLFILLIKLILISNDKDLLFGILLISIFVSLPLFTDILQFGHDIDFHLNRIANIGREMACGDFPVRINTAFKINGSITPIMYPELFLYFPGFMCFTRASAMFSLKTLIVIMNIVCGFISYYSAKQVVNKKAAFIFAILYIFNPYRLNNFYCRAALGEFIAMTFLPLAFAGLYNLIQGDSKSGIVQSVIGISSVLQSHIISIFLFAVFGSIYAIYYLVTNFGKYFSSKDRIKHLLIAAIFTVLINLWFLVPFVKYLGGNYYVFNDLDCLKSKGVYLYQMFMDIFNTNPAIFDTTTAEMPESIGMYSLIGIILVVYYLSTNRKENNKKIIIPLLLGIFACLLASSLFPWGYIKDRIPFIYSIFKRMQFSFRFLSIAALMICFAISIVLEKYISDNKKTYAYVFIIFALISSIVVLNGYTNENETYMYHKWDSFTSSNKDYCYIDDNYENTRNFIYDKKIISSNRINISEFNIDGSNYHIEFDSNEGTSLKMPIYYYDDLYSAMINGEKVPIYKSNINTIELKVPKEIKNGFINISKNNSAFYLADLISIISIMSFVYITYIKK